MNDIYFTAAYQILLSYVFVLVTILIVRGKKLGSGARVIKSSLRMTIQLAIAGIFLNLIFENPHPLISVGIMLFMVAFSVYTIRGQFAKGDLSNKLITVIFLSLAVAAFTTNLFFNTVIIPEGSWYNPTAFVPIAGMLVSNSMNATSLCVKTMQKGMNKDRHIVEERLILGADPHEASKEVLEDAFNTALLPTLNSMLTTGIVAIPGMMSGQILAGQNAIAAVGYQTAIMLAILAAGTIAVSMTLSLGYKSYFNDQDQLIYSSQE